MSTDSLSTLETLPDPRSKQGVSHPYPFNINGLQHQMLFDTIEDTESRPVMKAAINVISITKLLG